MMPSPLLPSLLAEFGVLGQGFIPCSGLGSPGTKDLQQLAPARVPLPENWKVNYVFKEPNYFEPQETFYLLHGVCNHEPS
jgi:hypothetical protein